MPTGPRLDATGFRDALARLLGYAGAFYLVAVLGTLSGYTVLACVFPTPAPADLGVARAIFAGQISLTVIFLLGPLLMLRPAVRRLRDIGLAPGSLLPDIAIILAVSALSLLAGYAVLGLLLCFLAIAPTNANQD